MQARHGIAWQVPASPVVCGSSSPRTWYDVGNSAARTLPCCSTHGQSGRQDDEAASSGHTSAPGQFAAAGIRDTQQPSHRTTNRKCRRPARYTRPLQSHQRLGYTDHAWRLPGTTPRIHTCECMSGVSGAACWIQPPLSTSGRPRTHCLHQYHIARSLQPRAGPCLWSFHRHALSQSPEEKKLAPEGLARLLGEHQRSIPTKPVRSAATMYATVVYMAAWLHCRQHLVASIGAFAWTLRSVVASLRLAMATAGFKSDGLIQARRG